MSSVLPYTSAPLPDGAAPVRVIFEQDHIDQLVSLLTCFGSFAGRGLPQIDRILLDQAIDDAILDVCVANFITEPPGAYSVALWGMAVATFWDDVPHDLRHLVDKVLDTCLEEPS